MSIPQEEQYSGNIVLHDTIPLHTVYNSFSCFPLFFFRFHYSASSRTKDVLMLQIFGLYQISDSVHSDLLGSIFCKFLSMAEIAVVSLCGGGQLKNILVLFAFFVANMEKNGKFIKSRSKLKIYLN